MDQEVTVIEQYPFSGIVAFNANWQLSHFLQLLSDLIGNGLALPLVRGCADYEIVCK